MKKSEYLSFHIDAITKAKLTKIAEEKKWSNSQLVEQIIQDWLKQNTEKETQE